MSHKFLIKEASEFYQIENQNFDFKNINLKSIYQNLITKLGIEILPSKMKNV